MKTQQEVVKMACSAVLGRVPMKGEDAKSAFTPEVREKIADFMMPLLGTEWEIKSDRTKARAREYITGVQSTDLLQNWTFEKKPKDKGDKTAAAIDPISAIKTALDAGLITKDEATAATKKALGL